MSTEELTDSQLILLDNLIYLNDVANQNGETVENIVKYLLHQDGLDKSKTEDDDGNIHYPGSMERWEWEDILRAIEKDPQLCELKLRYGRIGEVYDNNGKPITKKGVKLEVGDRMATFVDPKGNATVVFRGTAGDMEWHDNGTGGYLSDTEMQQIALEYIESLPYTNITVTGHSKGGNKAQYVGILSDKVDRVLSLDGQGFSKEFYEKYKDLIAANRHKITSISAEDDFVNPLLITLAEENKRFYIDTEYQSDFIRNHSPGIVLDKNGQLRDPGDQGAIPKLVNDLTVYLNAHMPEPDRSYVMDGLLALMETGNEGFQKESESHTKESINILLPYLKDYLLEKAAQGGKDFLNLLGATLGAFIVPEEYLDDFIRYMKINTENFRFIRQLAQEVGRILRPIIIEKLTEFLHEMANKIKDTANRIAEGIIDFAHKLKAGWDALVQGVGKFLEDLKNAGIAAFEALQRFKDNVFQKIKAFGNWVAEGTRRAIVAVKAAWHSAVDKVKGWFNTAKDKVLAGVEALKNGVERAAVWSKEQFHKFVDATVNKAKQIGEWLVRKLNQAKAAVREIGAKISAAFIAFADKLKEGWESLKAGMRHLAERAKNTAVGVYEALAKFAQTLSQTVKSFCAKLAAAFKQMLEGVKKTWNNLVDKVTDLFGKVKSTISLKASEYKDNMKSLVKLTKDKVKSIGKQAYKEIKSFTGKVVKGMVKLSGGVLMVSVDRLSDLQTKFKRMDDTLVSTANRITSDAAKIVSSVSHAYSESNVQNQIRQLQRDIDELRSRSRRVASEMDRKIRTIGLARDQFVKVEQMVKHQIGSLN